MTHIMKGKEMHQMSSEELRKLLADAKLQKVTLLGLSKGKKEAPKNSSAIKENRRTIARAMTILVQRGERCV